MPTQLDAKDTHLGESFHVEVLLKVRPFLSSSSPRHFVENNGIYNVITTSGG